MSPAHLALLRRGWIVSPGNREREPPERISRRFETLPRSVWTWLASASACHRADEAAWFLTPDDYAGTGYGFAWDEFERIGVEAGSSDQEREAVHRFWDTHFPFAMAVGSAYDYFAIDLGSHRGTVVHGSAPEWENPSLLCPTFPAFVERLECEAGKSTPAFPFSLFLGELG